jgi:hypothetical protein
MNMNMERAQLLLKVRCAGAAAATNQPSAHLTLKAHCMTSIK